MKKILITGGTGFIGHHLVEHLLKNTDWEITILDRFDISVDPKRLLDIDVYEQEKHRLKFVWWDLKAEINDSIKKRLNGPFDYIAHLAAGSHVDRSIDEPMEFFMDNCIGTINLLNYTRDEGLIGSGISFEFRKDSKPEHLSKFLYFSTDEVFGPAPETVIDHDGDGGLGPVPFEGFQEWDRMNPNNPYAAAKAAAEMACIAFANTYNIPITITNTMNVFGERQNREKFIPLIINKVLNNEVLKIHADKTKTHAGKRHYLHARNISEATLFVLRHGLTLDGTAKQGRYNIVGEREVDNLTLAQLVASMVHDARPDSSPLRYELVDFHSARPGHDLRYALDGSYLSQQGFSYPVDFENSLRKMVEWTLAHPEWL